MSQIAERSIAEAGLGLSDFAALEALLHKGTLTITEIQANVLLATGSMTAAVDRLERKGLLVRRPNPSDRRAKKLELTLKGRRVVEAAFERHARELEAPWLSCTARRDVSFIAFLRSWASSRPKRAMRQADRSYESIHFSS
jgi:MarR family 2-MHQ and catechol resistance regulon transcriptional repressor